MTIKVHEIVRINNEDYRQKIEITQDNKSIFDVMDDEPEDSNMGRSFSDCCDVFNMLIRFYEMGKNGVHVEFTNEEVEW